MVYMFSWKTSACWRCGRTSHITTNYKENTYYNSEPFTDDDSDEEKVSSKTTQGTRLDCSTVL